MHKAEGSALIEGGRAQGAPKRRSWMGWRPSLSTEGLAVCVSLMFALAYNGRFLSGTLSGRDWSESSTWVFGACMVLLLWALHTLLLCLVLHRRFARPLLAFLIGVTALATYYMQRFGVYLDPTMLRNALHTGPVEAGRACSGVWMLPHLLLFGALPIALAVVGAVCPSGTMRRAALSAPGNYRAGGCVGDARARVADACFRTLRG